MSADHSHLTMRLDDGRHKCISCNQIVPAPTYAVAA